MELKEIRQLVRMLEGTDVSEIEIRNDETTVRITRAIGNAAMPQQVAVSMAPVAAPAQVAGAPASAAPAAEVRPANLAAVESPMVGTFYRSASPESPAFVDVGDTVKKGQVVCIIEAMKLMNEIESEVSGRVLKVLKDNASPVEYGEELFLIEPA